MQVVAGENFWGSIAGQLGGTHVSVTSIVTDPNADPHEYESNTSDARAFAAARYVVLNGAGYDNGDVGVRSNVGDPKTNVVDKGATTRDIEAAPQGGDTDQGVRVGRVGEELEGRQQARGDEQRLRHGGVPDGLGVGVDAVVLQVETAHGAEPGQPVGERGLFDPGAQEARGLGPLPGRDDCQHAFTLS